MIEAMSAAVSTIIVETMNSAVAQYVSVYFTPNRAFQVRDTVSITMHGKYRLSGRENNVQECGLRRYSDDRVVQLNLQSQRFCPAPKRHAPHHLLLTEGLLLSEL